MKFKKVSGIDEWFTEDKKYYISTGIETGFMTDKGLDFSRTRTVYLPHKLVNGVYVQSVNSFSSLEPAKILCYNREHVNYCRRGSKTSILMVANEDKRWED